MLNQQMTCGFLKQRRYMEKKDLQKKKKTRAFKLNVAVVFFDICRKLFVIMRYALGHSDGCHNGGGRML